MENIKKSTLLIPLDVIKKVLTEKKFPEFQLFVYLKMICDGKIKINTEVKEIIKDKLELKSTKTVTNRLNKLLDYNWVGYSKKSKYYFIRRFEFLRHNKIQHIKTNVEFSMRDIHQMKAFIIGACICYIIKRIECGMRKVDSKKGGSNQSFRKPPSYLPLANNYIAKTLNISISTAHEYKTIAAEKKYFLIRKKSIHLDINKNAKLNILKNDKEIGKRLRIYFNKLYLQGTDEVLPLMNFKTKKTKRKIFNKV